MLGKNIFVFANGYWLLSNKIDKPCLILKVILKFLILHIIKHINRKSKKEKVSSETDSVDMHFMKGLWLLPLWLEDQLDRWLFYFPHSLIFSFNSRLAWQNQNVNLLVVDTSCCNILFQSFFRHVNGNDFACPLSSALSTYPICILKHLPMVHCLICSLSYFYKTVYTWVRKVLTLSSSLLKNTLW